MRNMKRFMAVSMAAVMAAGTLAGCGSSSSAEGSAAATSGSSAATESSATSETPAESAAGSETASAEGGKVYYLNFKPEQADQWVDLAEKYTEETGVQVDVQTAASGTYESTLKAEMAKSDAPTMFQVNGPVGLATWKDYCYDLSGSKVYGDLVSDDYALKDGDAVQGIAYVIETYGIIYNKKILNDYFGKDYATIKSIDDLNNFNAPQVWILPLTGDLRHIWQTCRSTMSTKTKVSHPQMPSRVHTLTTTKTSGICTSTMLHVSRA